MSARVDRASRLRLYSQKLFGFEGPGCNIPACRARRAMTTGWLEQSAGLWSMEFECPDHGTWLSFGGPGSSIIPEVLVDSGFRIYSQKLLGFEDLDCKVPKCRAPPAPSTGWLERIEPDRWYMEFKCFDHGPSLMTGGPWTSLIEEALKDRGLALKDRGLALKDRGLEAGEFTRFVN